MNTVKNYTTIHLLLNQVVKLNNNLNGLFNKVCVPNKTRFEYKLNESNILIKGI